MSLRNFIEECHNNLIHNTKDQEVSVAQTYLKSRNLLEKSIISAKIGYCSKDSNIPDPVRFFGEETENEKKWDLSYNIRGKIIVPIFSEFRTPVGLATRKPTSEVGNTWWNLPSPFKKGSHLYLLNLAKKSIFEKNKIYLVEGYMDALILRQYGLDNVVAIMGTALTIRKIGLIARYCNNICICFDMDKNLSGQKAMEVAILNLKRFNFCDSISTIIGLPVGEDPDVFVTSHGLPEFLNKERTLDESEIEKICRNIVNKKVQKNCD